MVCVSTVGVGVHSGVCTVGAGVCTVGLGLLKAPEQGEMTLKAAQGALIFCG